MLKLVGTRHCVTQHVAYYGSKQSSCICWSDIIHYYHLWSGRSKFGRTIHHTIIILSSWVLWIYKANIIQYGLDQLRDAPSQDLVVFLYCYFWSYYCSAFTTQGIFAVHCSYLLLS